MGALAPFGLPNTRHTWEAAWGVTGPESPDALGLLGSLVFGLPAVDTQAAAAGLGTGTGIVAGRASALAAALGVGTGTGLASGAVAAAAAISGLGTGTGLVAGTVQAAVALSGLGAGSSRVSAITTKPTLYERLNPAIAGLRATLARPIGDRPYRVYLTIVRWDGGAPGLGNRAPVRIELRCGFDKKTGLPQPPKLTRTKPSGWQRDRRGMTASSGEANRLYLTQLDPGYTARDLVPYIDLAASEEAYVEIENVGVQGGDARTRPVDRYTIDGAPWFDQPKMGWVLALLPAEPSKSFGGPR